MLTVSVAQLAAAVADERALHIPGREWEVDSDIDADALLWRMRQELELDQLYGER